MTPLTERHADKTRGALSCLAQKMVTTALKLKTLFFIPPLAEPLTMTT
jgi:hypothetical protein